MFNSPNDNFGLYEGNPLLRKESSQNGFGKTFKVSSERLKKRNRKWKYLLVLSFFVDCAVSPNRPGARPPRSKTKPQAVVR